MPSAVPPEDSKLRIESLYVYPVKSFRGISLDSAILTRHGFLFDRQYMLLQQVDSEDGGKTLKNMSVSSFNEMVRFFPEILIPKDGDSSKGVVAITFKPVDGGEPKTIDIPLEPDTSQLESIDVLMHLSPTQAYKMDDKYNDWLSSCFGFDCVLAYIGKHIREVRMSSPHTGEYKTNSANGWLSSISSIAGNAAAMLTGANANPKEIRFSDVAPYLFVSLKSLEDVNRRLPEGEEYDITKFRPNAIVSGAREAWDEDFWAELTIGGTSKLECEHNCGRCRSINIDYDTGAQGKGEAGKMLKKLSSDRRVDKGTKWSPIFGRYSFVHPESEGNEIRVGDEVVVSRTNEEQTSFDWKGLSTLPGGGRE